MYSLSQTEETIAAIATAVAAGQGGIAVVRMSGKAAKEVGQSVVSIPGSQVWCSHRVLYGHVLDEGNKEHIDEVLVLIMDGPRSFTGEDVVEIHCHGGLITVQRVLNQVLAHPKVRRALPGEFSQRAVLNGRLDVTQAEAISDLISARSKKAAQLAMAGVDGGISRRITALRERLLDQLSEIEARVDFEDELPPLDETKLLDELDEIYLELNELVEDAQQGAYIRQGLKIVLIGCPNVGKSSLLNLLSRREKAIVTDLPGTTRDLLESEIILEGVPMTLLDTAGIRKTDHVIEQEGIERSHQALRGADVVMLIFDLAAGWSDQDQKLLELIPNELPKILVGNKSDIQSRTKAPPNCTEDSSILPNVSISALTGKGEENLIQALLKVCGANEIHCLEVALNERQRDLATQAAEALARTKDVANQNLPWDFWTIDIREAIHKLGELTGAEVTEEILNRIFSRFCIGK